MTALRLGDTSRFMTVDDVVETYGVPKKVVKFRRHLDSAENVAVLPDNKIVVSDKVGQRVRVFDTGGNLFGSLGEKIRPEGVTTTASGMVALVDSRKKKNRCIRVFSSVDGNLYSKWGEEFGSWMPKGIAFSNRGHLVVSQVTKNAHSVGLYTIDGKQLHKFGGYGSGGADFNGPCYVAVDMFDRVIVSDKNNHVVKLFDERGVFLGKIGGYGTGEGRLHDPRGVCSDSSGNIFVCDSGNRRVAVFSLYGRFVQDVLTSKQDLGYPFGIAYSKEANQLVVTQNYSNIEGGHLRKIRVYELDPLPPLKIGRKSVTN
ncbi:hypothetical protein LSH36_68g15003 [Paralvinella palmiformis]|uniref:Uncharacterized protein n=1 Tax=Paralvinella palmiformis TaxID=53620 RepID=A0AAD9ND39_9ANNE|nr:hypothetical protein LSH36_68g15003 [Paralvinella palmiformis]